MIALTQGQREELVSRLKIYIRTTETAIKAGLATEEDLFNLEVRKIALASLMAEKIATVDVVGVIWNEWKPEVGTPLFTAPPVPEIKFPQIVSRSEIAGNEVAREWFLRGCDWYEKEIKRLHGLGE